MAILKPQYRRRSPRLLNEPLHAGKKLRSGKVIEPWTLGKEQNCLEDVQKRRKELKKRRQKIPFPFLKLPAELRLQVYGHLLRASSKYTPRRALAKLRPRSTPSLGDGVIVLRKMTGKQPHAHHKSALPSLSILRACQQTRVEALHEIYKYNTFEVVARTQRRPGQLLFNMPGFLRLDLVRDLVMVTHSEVSRFQSCFAYEMFTHLTCLRKISIAMKTTPMHDEPDFHSCLEALNIVLWIGRDVKVEFSRLEDLMHHDHPAWVSPRILAAYFETFDDLRGVGLSTWTEDVAIAYDEGLTVAKSFSIL